MAINLNDENLNMMNNSAIPEGWEIENNQEITKEQNLANSIIDIPEGWEIESEPSNVSSTMVEQQQMRETYLSAAPKYNLIDKFKNTLNQVNSLRLNSASAYQEGKNTTRVGELEIKDMFGLISDDEKNELNILSNLKPLDYGVQKKDNFYKKEYQTAFNKFAKSPKEGYFNMLRMVPYTWENIKAAGVGGVAGGVIGGAVTKSPAGFRTGFGLASKIAGTAKIAQLETGLARNEIKKINQEIIEKGGKELSNAEINILSIGAGTLSAGFEVISLKKILKTIPAGDKIIDYLEKGAIREVVQDKTLREQIKRIAKDYGEAVLTETATEMMQETTNMLAKRIARGLGKIENQPWIKEVEDIVETGFDSLGAIMFLGGATSGSKVATIYAKQEVDKLNEKIDENLPSAVKKTIYSADFEIQKIKKRAQEFAKSLTPEQQAQYVEDNFDTLVETVNDMPSVQEIENEEKAKEEFNSFKNRLFVQNLNAGQEKDVAKYEADIMAQGIKSLARISKKTLKEAEDMIKLNIQNLNSKQAADVLQGRVSLEENKLNFQDDISAEQRKANKVYQQASEIDFEQVKAKYTKTGKVYDNFVQLHTKNNLVEKVPEYWQGETVEEALEYLGIKDNKGVKIKSPIEEVSIYKSHMEHLINDNNAHRKKYLNRAIRTIQEPNLITKSGNYHNYIKLFSDGKNTKPHLQIVKVKEDGNFYVTTLKPTKRQGDKTIIEGQVIYDLSSVSSENITDDSIITNSQDDFNSNIKEHEEKNLIMAHASKLSSLDEVIETGSLIAPSFSITTKESETLEEGKFGEVIFIRNPKKIDYQNDNIYDRDIYSPRMPMPHYDIPDGRVVDSYEYDNLKRSYERAPENFVEKWGETFDEYFKGAKKVLFLGYTPSGNRKYVPYNAENILKEMNKKGLLNKEGFDYGLSSLLARFSTKQTSKSNLKETTKTGLSKSKDISKQWEEIKDEYDKLGEKVAEYYYDKWSFYEVQSDAFYALAKNMKKTINDLFSSEVPKELQREVKEFVEKAKSLPRSYFEAKPMREIELSEFSNVLVRSGELTQEQKQRLEDWGVKVTEYEKGKLYETLETLNKNEIYFQETEQNNYYHLDNGDNVVKISKIEDLNEVPSIVDGAIINFETFEVGKNYTILSNGKKQIVGPTLTFNGNKNGILEFSNNKEKEYQRATIEINKSKLDNYKGRIYPAEFNVKEKIKEHNKKVNDYVIPQEPVKRLIDTNKPLREILDEKRGLSTTRYNFDGTIKDNLIVLLKNRADKSTLLHEFAHVYLTTLNMLALADKSIKDELNTLNKWLDYRGGQYTKKQHEKFAKGFEAYVMSGKAPTYTLKRAFENFRVWLKDIYNNILLGDMANELELDKETKEIFDNLLGDISVEVRNKRSKELIEKARANASLRLNNDYANKKKIQPNQLTDKQIRYRDTAYSIIWTALQNLPDKEIKTLVKSKQELYMILGNTQSAKKENKGVATRRETIEFVLREIGDVFSANDGFLSEWGEFFSPELIENGQDAEFVMQAYDVIVNKEYLYSDKNNNEFSEEDLNRIQYEYEYFIDFFKNDYSNRDIAMAAYWDWIEEIPEFIQQDYLDKWELTTNEIDRRENLTKFQKAKEDLKLHAATLRGRGDYSSQFAEFARAIFKRLDFMSETDKAKIFNTLKDYNSFRELERNLDNIMDYAQTIDDVSMRHQIADKIVFEIRKTTPEYINGRKKHLYDYQTNKLFIKLREINALKQEEAQELYDALVNKEIERRAQGLEKDSPTIEDKKAEEFYDDVVNSFIQFKANGMYFNSNELLVSLLEKIQAAKLIGKTSRDAIDFEKKVNQKNWIDNCASALEEHKKYSQEQKNEHLKKVQEIAKELYSMEANFDSLLYLMFNEKIRKKFTLDTKYAEVDARVGADRAEVIQKIMNVYRLKGRTGLTKLQSIFIDMTKDKYKIKQRYANKEENDSSGLWQWEEIELSRMEILYYYIQAKNPVSYQMLTDMGTETRSPKGQFNKVDFDELLKNLSDQEKLMGDILQLAAEKYYSALNKYHIKKYHIDLGKTTCYFPRKSQQSEVNELDLFNQYSEKSINPSFEKLRTAGPSVRIAPSNPFDVLFSYMQKANTIIVMGEDLDLINRVFRDNDLADKIKTIHGQKEYREFMQHITENLYSGQTKIQSEAEGMISSLMNNVVLTPMMIKPQIGIKQVMGAINYAVGDEFVTSSEWFEEFKKCIKKPKETIEFMMQDGYTKDRLERANLNEALKSQTDNKLFSKTSLLTDWFTLNMRYGDTLNLSFGGKAYVDALIKKGYTKEQAFELYRKKTISDQQSSINSTLSNLQRNSKSNPFAKLVFAYQNTPHQYFRICADSIIKAVRGDMPKARAIKNFFFYWYLTSFIFNMATSLSPLTLLMTGDDDELKADAILALLGPISCIPFFGETARAIFCAITQQEYIGNRDWFTRFNQAVVRPIKKILDGDGLTWEDVSDSAKVISQGAAIPFEQGITTASGIGDIFSGDFGKGILKTLGYSEYRANKVFGDD